MAKIKAQNLTFSFENRAIFSALNFEWTEARIGVLGRNGSGKSTLARLIAGLIAPSDGSLRVDGFDLYENRAEALNRVGIVFQNPDHQIIFPTVIEELKFGFSQQGHQNAEGIANQILEKYQKLDWKDRLVVSLSQGQRHFLALISILEMQPKILILDEPFIGLDIPSVMRLQSVLASFEGMIVHITHEPSLIDDYDRVIWLENGETLGDGAPADVIKSYQTKMYALGASDADAGI